MGLIDSRRLIQIFQEQRELGGLTLSLKHKHSTKLIKKFILSISSANIYFKIYLIHVLKFKKIKF